MTTFIGTPRMESITWDRKHIYTNIGLSGQRKGLKHHGLWQTKFYKKKESKTVVVLIDYSRTSVEYGGLPHWLAFYLCSNDDRKVFVLP
jgi:hypothetical protein